MGIRLSVNPAVTVRALLLCLITLSAVYGGLFAELMIYSLSKGQFPMQQIHIAQICTWVIVGIAFLIVLASFFSVAKPETAATAQEAGQVRTETVVDASTRPMSGKERPRLRRDAQSQRPFIPLHSSPTQDRFVVTSPAQAAASAPSAPLRPPTIVHRIPAPGPAQAPTVTEEAATAPAPAINVRSGWPVTIDPAVEAESTAPGITFQPETSESNFMQEIPRFYGLGRERDYERGLFFGSGPVVAGR